MPSAGFEPAIPATKRPKTYAFHRAFGNITTIKSSVKWAGYVARIYMINAFCTLVGKLEWKRQLIRYRRRWEDSNKMGLKWIRWEDVDWIWLRVGTGDGVLWTRLWSFGYHNRRAIFWRDERLLAYQGLCSTELGKKLVALHRDGLGTRHQASSSTVHDTNSLKISCMTNSFLLWNTVFTNCHH
jgi:hypothetical protein